jgi:hypothetical protein
LEVYIDYNQNGGFTDGGLHPEEKVGYAAGFGTTTIKFTVPQPP